MFIINFKALYVFMLMYVALFSQDVSPQTIYLTSAVGLLGVVAYGTYSMLNVGNNNDANNK